jgi:hypothetical protein
MEIFGIAHLRETGAILAVMMEYYCRGNHHHGSILPFCASLGAARAAITINDAAKPSIV